MDIHRKRQSGDILGSLDSNMTPRPARKKRLSLLPSNVNIGAPRLMQPQRSSLQMSAARRTSRIPQNGITRRMSTLGRAQQQQLYPPSSGGRLFDDSGSMVTSSSQRRGYMGAQARDPRPLRDRNFQARLQHELFEYLSTSKFDIEMKTQLSARTLKSPTQKEFILMFQFLYRKIDPGYKFVRAVEQDIYQILKFAEYPYLDHINKSQLSAVGGTNWPTFLAMLHWLMQLVRSLEGFDEINLMNLPQEREKEDGSSAGNTVVFNNKQAEDSVLVQENSAMDKLFTNFALKSYRSYLATGTDDYSEFYAEMETDYQQCTHGIVDKARTMSLDNEELSAKLGGVAKEQKELHLKVERTRALEIDVTKFQQYVDLQHQRSQKWPAVIEKARQDIESIKKSIHEAEQEKKTIESDLRAKGFTLQDIEAMHKERATLSGQFDSVGEKQEMVKKGIATKMENLGATFAQMKQSIDQYNRQVYGILDTVQLANIPQLTVTNFSHALVSDESKLGQKPDELIPELKQLDVQAQIAQLKNTVEQAYLASRDEALKLQEKLDDLKLNAVGLKDQLSDAQDKLAKSKAEYTELNQQKSREVSANQKRLEQQTEQIRQITQKLDTEAKQVQQDYTKAEDEMKRATGLLAEQRNKLLIQLASGMEYTVAFKTGVMAELEGANAEAVHELEDGIDPKE